MDISLSDFDSSSESSSSEDQDDIEYMFGGQASCILSSLEETIGKIDNFLSFERGYILGDIVCLITDPSGQIGKVIDVDMFVDLESIHGLKMKHVNSKRLQKIKSLSVGDHVVQGSWLGRVDRIVDRIRVLFEDGTKCDFTTMGPEKLVPVSPDILEDSQLLFYPGQRVRIEPSSVVKSARWLCGKQNRKQDEGIVCAVDAGLVYVDWLGCALVGCERGPAPPRLQDSKNLKLLSCFSHANWQMGDWCKLANADDNCVTEQIAFDASNYLSIEMYKQSENVFQRKNFIPTFQEIFVIVKKKTKVDVLWQDGSLSVGLDPNSLFPIDVLEAHDFLPDQFVLEKGTCDDPHAPCIQRWGVVRSVDAEERTVNVKWKTFAADQMNNLEKVQVEEIVSAYELVEHPDYSFCLGDVVFRFEKDHFMDIVNGKNFKYRMANKFEGVEEAGQGGKFWAQIQSEYGGNSHFSHIGIVIGFKDEDVEVKWVTGLTTKVAPYEIFQFDKHEYILGSPVPHENNPNISYEEMTDHVNQTLGSKGKDLFELNGNDKDCQVRLWNSIAFFFPRAAIGFLTSIAGSFFGSLCSVSLSSASDHISEYSKRPKIPNDEEVLEPCNLCNGGSSLLEADSQGFVETSDLKAKETLTNKDLPFSSGSTYANQFRHFDMVEQCFDHHFVNSAGEAQMLSQIKRSWLKKVQKEWSLLEKDLPETIYVRVYEERMDFLRAAIVGAPGTPYHDGLFFFDIFLPPEYPQVPPMVHYISGGLRLNPNLYESGKICLSLLNTWTGTGSEVWNSSGSTILQVLLSLQALVLNEKPYFNEAGYDIQIGQANGMKNSVSYNENAFIVSCKSMLYLLRKPPKHFEALVHEHFSKRCRYILSACKEYMEGVPVGFSSGYQTPEFDNQKGSSTGFKIMLGKLFPKLVEAFSENGMDCSQFLKPEN